VDISAEINFSIKVLDKMKASKTYTAVEFIGSIVLSHFILIVKIVLRFKIMAVMLIDNNLIRN
jgi:hypothetical protein